MDCLICGSRESLLIDDSQGKEIVIAPAVKVWCCDRCVEAILFNAAVKAFHEKYQKVKE